MTQYQLDSAVAMATGEPLEVISQFGFVPLTAVPYERERVPHCRRKRKRRKRVRRSIGRIAPTRR